jgi:glutamine amidotransferase
MVYLLAAIANDAEYTPALLYTLGAELAVPEPPPDSDEIWGIGYYADNRALIIRKPADILPKRSFYELSPSVTSRVVLATIERDPPSLEKSPPYRFRRWLFASTGDLAPLANLADRIQDKLPDFVRTDAVTKGGPGIAFGMFLAELHRGGLLDDPLATPQTLAEALGRTSQTIARLSTEANQNPVAASYVATNGKHLLLAGGGVPIFWKEQRGLESLPDGPPDPALTDFKQIAEALKRFRAIVVARDVGSVSGWNAIESGELYHVGPNLQMTKV